MATWMNLSTSIMFDYLYKYDDTREHVRDLAQVVLGNSTTTTEAADKLETMLEDEYLHTAPKLSGVYGELFNSALESVDFYQIAKRFIDEA